MDELESAKDRALQRGLTWLEEFKRKPLEDHLEYLAQTLYSTIELDPYGYPNGRPSWSELPEIDTNHKLGTDKFRYRTAAEHAYKIFQYMTPDK